MSSHKTMALAVASAMFSTSAFCAGFALYEGSAKGTALGGAVMGKAVDASANFYNPATMADFTNTVVTVGFVTEHPTADTVIDGRPGRKMDPGAFLLPHFHLVQPLPYDFAFGLGFAPEFGLGTHYNPGWALDWNTQKTTVRGLTLTPNLSYSITEDWSVSAGFRVLYFDFEQYSYQYTGARNLDGSLNRGRFRLKGDNGFTDWGWQLSTRYRITDTFSVGAMYKSYIDSKIKGEARMTGAGNAIVGMGPTGPIIANVNSIATGDASADIRLPQSVTIGANWDALDTLHLGTALTWTEWSSMPAINFRLPTGRKPTNLGWDDVFRIGFGGTWDFHENFSLLGSYVFDLDPCSTKDNEGSTMLPPGDRHIGTVGLAWHYGPIDVTLSYGIVFMCSESVSYTHPATGRKVKFETEDGLSQAVGLSMTYAF